jgi:hypothetical protein
MTRAEVEHILGRAGDYRTGPTEITSTGTVVREWWQISERKFSEAPFLAAMPAYIPEWRNEDEVVCR